MGLMQIMPDTYDELRLRYALGSDPFEPHDNIMAGAAYIREMADRYGAPGFLAAYNAGPSRMDSYLTGGEPLPDETVNYVASVAPRIGSAGRMTGPPVVYAQDGKLPRDTVFPVPISAAGNCDPDAA
jgi:soluble lytic murein transglycosylase-like protein